MLFLIKVKWVSVVIFFLLKIGFASAAEIKIDAYELIYEEQEIGTDPYKVKFTVTERYIRIDQLGDQSGYIIYDNDKHIVQSVAHHDQSILVIPRYDYHMPDLSKLVNLEYYMVPDAPKISGKAIYSYRVTSSAEPKEKCLDITLAEGLLPDVSHILLDYQEILVGQQSRLLKSTPEEYRTNCFLYDQVFNKGDYYQKGLPIQEWHSNGKTRLLTSYKKVKVNPEIFKIEEGYQEYSVD
jgi:hypothetical protein